MNAPPSTSPTPLRPDFFCIGMQKAGTSWLSEKLKQHQSLASGLLKEPHYHDTLHHWPRLYEALGLPYAPASAKAVLLQEVLSNIAWVLPGLEDEARQDPERLHQRVAWFQQLVALREDIFSPAWYARVFANVPTTHICGDFTADTYLLGAHSISRLLEAHPLARFVMMLRDPVSRDWSQLRMVCKADSLQVVVDALESPAMIGRQRYREIIERWEHAAGAERIHFGFFDDVRARPEGLLDGIIAFLGLEPARSPWSGLHETVFEGPKREMPPAVLDLLVARNRDALEYLAQRFPEVAGKWRERYLGKAAGPSSPTA